MQNGSMWLPLRHQYVSGRWQVKRPAFTKLGKFVDIRVEGKNPNPLNPGEGTQLKYTGPVVFNWCSHGIIKFFSLLKFFMQQSCLEFFSSSSCTLLARFPFLWKDLSKSVSFYEWPPLSKVHLFLFKRPKQPSFFFLSINLWPLIIVSY